MQRKQHSFAQTNITDSHSCTERWKESETERKPKERQADRRTYRKKSDKNIRNNGHVLKKRYEKDRKGKKLRKIELYKFRNYKYLLDITENLFFLNINIWEKQRRKENERNRTATRRKHEEKIGKRNKGGNHSNTVTNDFLIFQC